MLICFVPNSRIEYGTPYREPKLAFRMNLPPLVPDFRDVRTAYQFSFHVPDRTAIHVTMI